jgi:phage gpG-like protein
MITITVDTSQLDKKLADFPARMAAAQKRALQAIGQQVASRATQAFRTASFRPSPWAPRKDKKSTHPLLIKSGNLRQSISWKLDGPDTVVIGSSQKYAPYHQHGTKNMPARPFFPIDRYENLTPSVAGKINRTVERIYVEELGKLGG